MGLNCHVNLHYNGLIVQVWSSDLSDLNWLQEFLCPFFDLVREDHYDCRVAMVADDRRFAEAFERGPLPNGAEIECFALDSSCIRLPLWNASSGQALIFDDECRVFYLARPDKTQIEILTQTGNPLARIALMRVVRELAMIDSHMRGGLFIHGAAFSVEGKCVVVAGPKRAGKTTLLMHALSSGNARFVSNDRVLVLMQESKAIARGMPTIVTIRKESLERLPELQYRLEASCYDVKRSLNEGTNNRTRPDHAGRFSLTPAQFCRFLQVTPQSQHQLGALVFPRIRATKTPIELEPLSFETAFSRLREVLFRSNSYQKTANFFRREEGHDPDETSVDKLCSRLISIVPCFECQLGASVYADPASAEVLFDLARCQPCAAPSNSQARP